MEIQGASGPGPEPVVEGTATEVSVQGRTLPLVRPPGVPVRAQYRRLYLSMAVTDTLAVALGLFLAHQARFPGRFADVDFFVRLALLPLVVVGTFALFSLYRVHHFAPAEEFRRIILAVSVSVIVLIIVSFWSRSPFSRVWVAFSWLLALVFALLSRRIWHWWVARARVEGWFSFRTLVVGTNAEARHLAELMERPTLGFDPIGFVATSRSPAVESGPPVLGEMRELRELIRTAGAECVFVAASAVEVAEMKHIAKAVRLEGVEVRVTATLPEVLSSRLAVQPVGGVMALSLRPVRLSGAQAASKRFFDLVVAVLGIVVTAPLWLAISLVIKLTSPGPVLFRQRRVGQRGGPFTMLKFRTMVVGADRMLEELRSRNEASGPLFKLRDDPRVSRIGRWLRWWSLDELPQLWNVVRGEMSLVGPRPPLPEEVAAYEDWQFDRLEVRPGITGLWQISGRSELSFDEYVRLDLFYIENWSLAYDLYILAKTIPVLVSRRGAY